MNNQNDVMDFPETFEEFALFYAFRDNEKVYTNGSDLIPVFRVKQWLEHVNRWIPVSERLPKKGEYGKVLVTYIPSGGTLWTTVIIAHYSDLMGISKPSFHVGEVGKESFQNITEQVIAWMPLPKEYGVEMESEE